MKLYASLIGILLLNAAQPGAFAADTTKSLWDIMATLRSESAMTRESIARDLSTELTLKNQNQYTLFYAGVGPQLNDNLRIDNIDFRVPAPDASSRGSFLVLTLEGKGCITLHDVKQHYDGLTLSQVPHGHSLEEETGYRTTFNHWRLAFGFKEKRPECLASVVFDSAEQP
ncbi:MAG: hypothetical protein E7B59_16540 [Enterobacteriaceae bacterium]|nr:hypothetical protein [Enterobacteriaceae bacterium]